MRKQEDIDLFAVINVTADQVFILGIIQLIGGLLLILQPTRLWGAYIMIPTYILASWAVLANEMWLFGVVSVLFIIMSILVVVKEKKYNEK